MISNLMIYRLSILPLTVALPHWIFGQGGTPTSKAVGKTAWRDAVRRAVESAHALSGSVPFEVRELQTSAAIASGDSWKLEWIRWDPLHRLSVLALRSDGLNSSANPVIVTTTQQLSVAAKRGTVANQQALLLIIAGERCKVTMTDGPLHMSLEGKALNSAAAGQVARVRIAAEHQQILRVSPTARGEAEVLP